MTCRLCISIARSLMCDRFETTGGLGLAVMTGLWEETLHRIKTKTIDHTSLHLSALEPSLLLKIVFSPRLLSLTIYGRRLNQKLIGGWRQSAGRHFSFFGMCCGDTWTSCLLIVPVMLSLSRRNISYSSVCFYFLNVVYTTRKQVQRHWTIKNH